jgi:hypothetical protein
MKICFRYMTHITASQKRTYVIANASDALIGEAQLK